MGVAALQSSAPLGERVVVVSTARSSRARRASVSMRVHRRPNVGIHRRRPRSRTKAVASSQSEPSAQPSQMATSKLSRRALTAGGLLLPPVLTLSPAALAAELKTLPTDKQYMVGVFRRGVPSFEDWYAMTFGDAKKTKRRVKEFGIVRTIVGGNDAMWSDNKAHALHVFDAAAYKDVRAFHEASNEWWPDIEMSAERAAQLQTQEKFNGLDDTATLKGPPDAYYFSPRLVGGAGGDPMDVLLKQPAKTGSGIAYLEMGFGRQGSFDEWSAEVMGGTPDSEALIGKAKILASVGGVDPAEGARGGVVHFFKSEFKAKSFAFDFPADEPWKGMTKAGKVTGPFHVDNFRVVHDIFWT